MKEPDECILCGVSGVSTPIYVQYLMGDRTPLQIISIPVGKICDSCIEKGHKDYIPESILGYFKERKC